jgi:hypothetical protein
VREGYEGDAYLAGYQVLEAQPEVDTALKAAGHTGPSGAAST